jgi:cell wall-associated NlpC family hydrolase
VVVGNRVKKIEASGGWYRVELPDGRRGYLARGSAQDYDSWKATRRATPESIEQTARRLLGRPYLWGANSPKGLDCSGLTKLVFALNGIDLRRNASHQARQGRQVPLDKDLTQLRKGDLVFFGSPPRGGKPERVTHIGIYLGDKLFIHSSERVRISSLDSGSPIRDEYRIKTLLGARRFVE